MRLRGNCVMANDEVFFCHCIYGRACYCGGAIADMGDTQVYS